MTKQEAISRLSIIMRNERVAWNPRTLEVFQMAIDALGADNNVGSKGGDLISRQAAIDVEGLDEQIRCEMCRNPMHTDRGCDGNCKYDEMLYERIMQILGERIKPLPSAQPEPGEWVEDEQQFHVEKTYHCSKCGHPAWGYIEKTKYCPGCGKYMGEVRMDDSI